jgi:hypothetical protein
MSTTLVKSDWSDWNVFAKNKPMRESRGIGSRTSDARFTLTEPSKSRKGQKLHRSGDTLNVFHGCEKSDSWRNYQHKWKTYGISVIDVTLQDCEIHYDNLASPLASYEVEYAKRYMRLLGTLAKSQSLRAKLPNARKFRRLAEQWYNETGMISMIHKKTMHPAYQRVIGMGKDALPFIFQELKKNHVHWLWALSAIHDDDVAKPGDTLEEAVAAWLKWGADNGYI